MPNSPITANSSRSLARRTSVAPEDSQSAALPLAWLRPYVSENQYEFITSNLGLLFVAGAQFFFACMNITVKYFLSVTPMAVTTLILVRMGITSLCGISALYIMGDPHPFLGPPEYRRLLFCRGGAGFVGLFTAYKSYTGLSVSDATAINYLTPSLTVIFAFLFLGERIAKREILAGLTCLGGVLLISRPQLIFGSAGGEVIGGANEGGVQLPGHEDLNRISRMEGVAWALLSVCGSTTACECE
jgi:drug/metabolite transporter (DMT)-like permease